jgi:RNA ligase
MFTLDQALAAIKDKTEFSVKDRGSYTVIDYNLSTKTTFVGSTPDETNILLNLRGTAFDNESREIIRLGYQKFFNHGEYPEVDEQLNFDYSHVITQKLDGSCIFPIFAKEGWVLGTRAGVTDVSQFATDFINQVGNENYHTFIDMCMDNGVTPIFEFCSRKNRVVLDYPDDMLILTGIRYINDGAYVSYFFLCEIANNNFIPVVSQIDEIVHEQFDNFKSGVTDMKDDEGVVIRFEGGNFKHHMIKLKAADYVLKHKAMDGLRFEKDVLLMSLNGLLDDVYPLLDDKTRERVQTHVDAFTFHVLETSVAIVTEFMKFESLVNDRKSFAIAVKDNKYKQFLFKLCTDRNFGTYAMLIDVCKNGCRTQASTIELKEFLGFKNEY